MCVAKFVEKNYTCRACIHHPTTHTHTHTENLYLLWYLFCACFEYNERNVHEGSGIMLCATRVSLRDISICRLRTVDCACLT
jgi:hypothetical protein